jgi:hypothetical protein
MKAILLVDLWPDGVLANLETNKDEIMRKIQAISGVCDVADIRYISMQTFATYLMTPDERTKHKRATPTIAERVMKRHWAS